MPDEPKVTSDQVRDTFANAPANLEVYVGYALDGYLHDRLYNATQVRGADAARELLKWLTDMPARAKCKNGEQFVNGYESRISDGGDALKQWEALLAEAFGLMMIDLRAEQNRTLELGQELVALVRRVAAFASPRLRAWGV